MNIPIIIFFMGNWNYFHFCAGMYSGLTGHAHFCYTIINT
jgi:hypothetical protein